MEPNEAKTTEGAPAAPSVPSTDELIAKARREEQARFQAELEKSRKAASELEARLQRIEEEKRLAELESMKPNERFQAQLNDMASKLQKSQETLMAREQAWTARARNAELTAYREMVLRNLGKQCIPAMVTGNSEEELDAAGDASHQAWKELMEQAKAEFSAQIPQQVVPVVAAPPHNPAYVQPQTEGGFPTATNAVPVSQVQYAPNSYELTSEEAVRSGRYSGQLRTQLLDQAKRTGATPLGNMPRYYAAAQPQNAPPMHQAMPGGVLQPQGSPMGPAQHPQMAQPQGHPQPGNSAQEAARAAIARVQSGAVNPLVSASDLTGALNFKGDGHGAARRMAKGATQVEFSQRFSPTPPVGEG